MEKRKTTTKIVFSLEEILVGNMMYAAAVVLFIVPNGLITGRTMELALFMSHSLGIPISLLVSVFNVTMFLLGVWVLDKQFALATVLSTIIYPVLLGAMEGSEFGEFVLEEKLVAVLYAGLLIDGGTSIVMRAGASTGGMDIPALVLKEKLDMDVSMTLYIMGCVVLGLQLVETDSHAILYGVMLIIVYTMVFNQILISGNARIRVKIVSRRYEEVNHLIAERIDCGTPLLHMRAGYLRKEQEIVLAVTSRRDLPRLNNLVVDEDPEALMIISQINEMKGRDFAFKRVYKEARQ